MTIQLIWSHKRALIDKYKITTCIYLLYHRIKELSCFLQYNITNVEASCQRILDIHQDENLMKKEALRNYKQCLKIKQEILGKNHPSYADTLNNIGIIIQKMGKYEEALKNYKECLEIQ